VSRSRKSIYSLAVLLFLALLGCQPPMPPVDTAAGISRATLIDSAIEWHADPQPIDAPAPANADDSALSLPHATELAIRNSAQGTPGSGFQNDFDNVVLPDAAVPEPTSLALIGLGVGGLVSRRRRVRRA